MQNQSAKEKIQMKESVGKICKSPMWEMSNWMHAMYIRTFVQFFNFSYTIPILCVSGNFFSRLDIVVASFLHFHVKNIRTNPEWVSVCVLFVGNESPYWLDSVLATHILRMTNFRLKCISYASHTKRTFSFVFTHIFFPNQEEGEKWSEKKSNSFFFPHFCFLLPLPLENLINFDFKFNSFSCFECEIFLKKWRAKKRSKNIYIIARKMAFNCVNAAPVLQYNT